MNDTVGKCFRIGGEAQTMIIFITDFFYVKKKLVKRDQNHTINDTVALKESTISTLKGEGWEGLY